MDYQAKMPSNAQGEAQAVRAEIPDPEIDNIARICHEANRSYCLGLGDTSQPPWSEAPEWQKTSARNGVRKHIDGPLILTRPGSGHEESHNSWMEEKLRAGWTYGATKDPDKKRHPCLLPYASLPPEERRKDVLFGAICNALDPRRSV